MPHYFINNHAQSNGDHEVHAAGCSKMPVDKGYLGHFECIGEALMEARKDFWQSATCLRCAGGDAAAIDTVRAIRVAPAMRLKFG